MTVPAQTAGAFASAVMPIRLLLPPVVLIAAASSALGQQAMPSEAAKAFTLPGLTPASPATPAPSKPGPADAPAPVIADPVVPQQDPAVAPAATIRGVFTLDTPIQDLIADAGAKAVLDKDLPGMSDDENLDKFKMLSLRSLQPQTGGQLTDAMLTKVAADLNLLAGNAAPMAMPTTVRAGSSKRNNDSSR